jgi:hypothetical protein
MRHSGACFRKASKRSRQTTGVVKERSIDPMSEACLAPLVWTSFGSQPKSEAWAEGGGLLIHPALFVLTPFHSF